MSTNNPFSEKEIEFRFQQEVLDQHGEYLLGLFVETLTQKNIRVSDELLQSLHHKVNQSGNDWVLNVSFMQYGRFLEIRKHKINRKTEKPVNTNVVLWGHKENRLKKRGKDVDWYSKNAFGSLNRLIGILMFELTEQERQRLIGILKNKSTQP